MDTSVEQRRILYSNCAVKLLATDKDSGLNAKMFVEHFGFVSAC